MSERDEQLVVAEAALQKLKSAVDAVSTQVKQLRAITTSVEITDHHRTLLRPFGEYFEAMALWVRESSDEELAEMLEACRAAAPDNVNWASYRAAQFLADEIGLRLLAQKNPPSPERDDG